MSQPAGSRLYFLQPVVLGPLSAQLLERLNTYRQLQKFLVILVSFYVHVLTPDYIHLYYAVF